MSDSERLPENLLADNAKRSLVKKANAQQAKKNKTKDFVFSLMKHSIKSKKEKANENPR